MYLKWPNFFTVNTHNVIGLVKVLYNQYQLKVFFQPCNINSFHNQC